MIHTLIGGARRDPKREDWQGSYVRLEPSDDHVTLWIDRTDGKREYEPRYLTPDQCVALAQALLKASMESKTIDAIVRENLANTGSGLDG